MWRWGLSPGLSGKIYKTQKWHTTDTVLRLHRIVTAGILTNVKKYQDTRRISSAGILIGGGFIKKAMALLRTEKGEASYISAVIFVLIGTIFIAFILNVFSLISMKMQLNQTAEQMAKQIQLAGGTNDDTFQMLVDLEDAAAELSDASYTLHTDPYLPRPAEMDTAIQLGTPFTITVSGKAKLGGFWNILPVDVSLSGQAVGVSEKYWK